MAFALSAQRWSLVAVGLTLGLSACGDAGPGEPLGQTESPITVSPDLFTNDQTAFDYFVGKGLASFQAAGIVGNLDQESGVDPNAVQARRPRARHRAVVGRRPVGHRRERQCRRVREQARAVRRLAAASARLHLVRADDVLRLRARGARGDHERHRCDGRLRDGLRGMRHVRPVDAHLVRPGGPECLRSRPLRGAVRGAELPAREHHADDGRRTGDSVVHRAQEHGHEDVGLEHAHRHDAAQGPQERLHGRDMAGRQPARRRQGHGGARLDVQVHVRSSPRPVPPAATKSSSASSRTASRGSATPGRAGRPTAISR